MTPPFDQFTRWLCPKCGCGGIDSWNKAIFDGTDHGEEVESGREPLPNPWILGSNCDRCVWPCVVSYTTPDAPPRAIFGPVECGSGCFAYEPDAMRAILADPTAAILLQPSEIRDADWSAGCLAAKAQLQ